MRGREYILFWCWLIVFIAGVHESRGETFPLAGIFEADTYFDINAKSLSDVYLGELDYRWNPKSKLGYQQQLTQTNSQSPGSGDLRLADGFFRMKLDEFWKDRIYPLTLSYESQIYMPTSPDRRAQTLIMEIRNYLTFRRYISKNLTMVITEVPIVHIYEEGAVPLSTSPTGQRWANALAENRVSLGPELSFGSGAFVMTVPLIFTALKYSEADAAALRSGKIRLMLTLSPAAKVYVLQNWYFGIQYDSPNFMPDDIPWRAGDNSTTKSGVAKAVLGLMF